MIEEIVCPYHGHKYKVTKVSVTLVHVEDYDMAHHNNGKPYPCVISKSDFHKMARESKEIGTCANIEKKYVSASKITIEDFFKRILLNYLISNGDAHLKNFSLHSKPNKIDYLLTPNYDLLNTRYHIHETYGDMALELLEDYTQAYEAYGYYTQSDFKEFAKYIELPDKRYEKIMEQAKESYLYVEAMINNSFLSDKGKKYYFSSYIDRLKRIGIK